MFGRKKAILNELQTTNYRLSCILTTLNLQNKELIKLNKGQDITITALQDIEEKFIEVEEDESPSLLQKILEILVLDHNMREEKFKRLDEINKEDQEKKGLVIETLANFLTNVQEEVAGGKEA